MSSGAVSVFVIAVQRDLEARRCSVDVQRRAKLEGRWDAWQMEATKAIDRCSDDSADLEGGDLTENLFSMKIWN